MEIVRSMQHGKDWGWAVWASRELDDADLTDSSLVQGFYAYPIPTVQLLMVDGRSRFAVVYPYGGVERVWSVSAVTGLFDDDLEAFGPVCASMARKWCVPVSVEEQARFGRIVSHVLEGDADDGSCFVTDGQFADGCYTAADWTAFLEDMDWLCNRFSDAAMGRVVEYYPEFNPADRSTWCGADSPDDIEITFHGAFRAWFDLGD